MVNLRVYCECDILNYICMEINVSARGAENAALFRENYGTVFIVLLYVGFFRLCGTYGA